MPTKPLSEDDLRTFLDAEEKDAIGYSWGSLSRERAMATDFYNARPYGNEKEGRSDMVSTEVFDTVEWTLPQLIRIFASTDKAVEFEPQGQEDNEGAKQATETCNYVFWRQNPGFLILYSWFKDALIQKNGFVKWWWATSTEKKRTKYRGLPLEMITMLTDEEGVEIVSQTSYPDPVASQMLQKALAQAKAQGQPIPPQLPEIPLAYDIEIEVTQEAGKVCIAPVPPEEVIISRRHNSIILNDSPFVSHVCQKTFSELRQMGYEFDDDDDDVNRDSPTWNDWSAEKIARNEVNEDGNFNEIAPESTDPSQKQVWVREIYCTVDQDGDGIAEKRRIIRAGNKIFENELCDHVQIATITPIIITHRVIGMSWAEMVMDLQFLASTIWRQMIDNLFHANNQGHIVLASADGRVQANIDDLLDSRPGRVIREYAPNAVRPEAVPWVAAQSFPMLEYIDQQRMNRSGTNYLSSGLQADSINKTARGAQLAQNMMQEKLELVARIFAEGVKEMFKGILYMLSKYQSRPMMFRLRNKFVNYDPSDWKTQYDMSINVGVGTGNKDQQLVHLQAFMEFLVKVAVPLQIATPQNVYNASAKMVENMGFRNVEEFLTDPQGKQIQPPQPPPPDPIEVGKLKVSEFEAQVKRFDAQTKRMAAMHAAQPQLPVPEQPQVDPVKVGELRVKDFEAQTHRYAAETQRLSALHSEGGVETAQKMTGLAENQATTNQQMMQMMEMFANAIVQALQEFSRPKRRVPVRDAAGNITHVDEVPVH